MKPIDMKTVEEKREEILSILKEPTYTHEQKVTYLARRAENFLSAIMKDARSTSCAVTDGTRG